ncbi:MAG: hypothetical protein H6732_05020 [Alphaproteobacteria bacterium]|nr:hypothetical protein [Alphaproteobacteria bacterium]
MRRLLPILLFVGCQIAPDKAGDTDSDGAALDPLPLGLPRTRDGVTLAGAAVVDLTPTIAETFTDLNGNFLFDGCFDDPSGTGKGCDEPFDDANGNGEFDAVFIGGFDPLRPARGVRDPITARALVLEDGGSYLAVVILDFVGLAHPRIDDAAALLAADGWDPDKLVVASTHNHQGPDTMGLWGNPEACIVPGDPQCRSGFSEAYQQRVAEGIAQAVREASASVRPVSLTVGALHLRDRSPYFNGEAFGGVNPTRKMHGMIHDIRDPVVVSDQVLAIQAHAPSDPSDVVFTWTSFSGHPEVRGGDNDQISADFVGVLREQLEARYGGIAIHQPECLGGMQSALGGNLPLVQADGTHVVETCDADDLAAPVTEGCEGKAEGDVRTYVGGPADGMPVPVWADKDSWDFVVSHGHHLAEAVVDALATGETTQATPLRSIARGGWVPVRNLAYNLLGPTGIFDLGLDEGTDDTTLCPEASEVDLGCIPFRVYRLQVGPVGFATAPGELLPELAWGLPTDDPAWVAEADDPGARGPTSTYFPQHDPACDTVGFEACRDTTGKKSGCDCLAIHAWPYTIAEDPTYGPVLADLDTKYRAAMSMTSTYLSYVVPKTDTNRAVWLLTDDGDHYEDTVTPAWDFGEIYLKTWKELQADW